ncbi:MAG: hypothetical protein IPK26_20890 [Planctomycetes bacterium]|nr:hypothetical protein [Planctomycetota bacterium]
MMTMPGVSHARGQSVPFATHDATTNPIPAVGSNPLGEQWTDVKSPGNGRTYAVGTIQILASIPVVLPTFSGVGVDSPTLGVSVPPAGGTRQVGVLQVRASNGDIVWQRHCHGSVLNPANFQLLLGLSTCVRAVSVFPALTEAATRIAVCGETFDDTMPLGQPTQPLGFVHPAGGNQCGGFVMVFDGAGALLWSHQFWSGAGQEPCSVTDVSIRVESRAQGLVDVVTYCGGTAGGAPAGGSPLSPLLRFVAPLPTCAGDSPAAGDSDNGFGQWDGFVGRIERNQGAGSVATPVFTSIVAGVDQELLLGLSEFSPDVFAVVGWTANTTITQGNFTLPLTQRCYSTLTSGSHALVMTFDAAPTRTGGDLVLIGSTVLGNGPDTIARDVLCHGGMIYLVGETRDASLPALLASQMAHGGPAGGTDGFVAATSVLDLSAFVHLGYWGGADNEGLFGVAAWNEYPDHIAVVGRRSTATDAGDIQVTGFFRNTPPPNPLPHADAGFLKTMLTASVVGPGTDVPASVVSGTTTAFNGGNTVDSRSFGASGTGLTGGAIAVDQRGRVMVVGSTNALGFPVIGPASNTRTYSGGTEAVSARVDLLPAGVCRTDGTGTCAFAPSAPFSGGTSPVCELLPFGAFVGGPPSGLLPRMLIDWEGSLGVGSLDAAILIDRPPASSLILGAVLQFGFPLAVPIVPTGTGMEIWTTGLPNVAFTFLPPSFNSMSSFRFELDTLPAGQWQFTAQVVCFVAPLACTGVGLAASPALLFSY